MLLALGVGVGAGAAEESTALARQAFLQGMLAMETGNWADAELQLERALMLDPDNAEVRLQLALLLGQRGKTGSARLLIQSLIEDTRTPPEHRRRLKTLLESLQTDGVGTSGPSSPATAAQTGAEITLGYVRNPFARAGIDELTLTLPGGDLTLPVDQKIRSAPVLGLTVRRAVPNEWGFEAGVQQFGEPEPKTAGRLWLYRDTILAGLPVRWSGILVRAVDRSSRQALGVTVPLGTWRMLAGAFNEPDSRRSGLSARLEHAWAPRPNLWTVSFGEIEHATQGRAGYASGGLYAQWVPYPRWMVAGQLAVIADVDGYSPLLRNNEPRRMLNANAAVEHFWELGADWRLLARAYVGRRWSNLDLFEYKDAGVLISIQSTWR